MFEFKLLATENRARAGLLNTPHGRIHTPVFAPVGTQGSVKAVTPAQLLSVGTSLVLANTYHLFLRPGAEIVQDQGGLHNFMNWSGPILTDSGGFQVFSLSKKNDIDDEGVTFKSLIDGSAHRFTPEVAIAIQHRHGADIIMAFDAKLHMEVPIRLCLVLFKEVYSRIYVLNQRGSLRNLTCPAMLLVVYLSENRRVSFNQ